MFVPVAAIKVWQFLYFTLDVEARVMRAFFRFLRRPPDISIGQNYLHRWYLIPRNRFFNSYLHKFERSDDDRAFHDHPWLSCSFLIAGVLKEHSPKGVRVIPRFYPVFRTAKFAHRLEVVRGPIWTLFITGPRVRQWGFHCPQGWRHWTEFTTPDGTQTGKGCD